MSHSYLGIDLGTTNSAAALFDGAQLTMVQSAHGGFLTPSVVRLDAKGGVTVGARARRLLEKDPDNTQAAFKRLIGSDQRLHFPASGQSRLPQELSAEVLRELLADAEQQLGYPAAAAVVAVPALFEVPQSVATAEAARLAGLARVELLQEPVASALAAGWKAESSGSWLVYDLGGGTFDVSLVESRDGLLRVVGHDGDNFLGGRDLDRALVDWACERLLAEHGVAPRRDQAGHGAALRRLALAAEEAKIELSRQRETALVAEIEVDGRELEVDLPLGRADFETLCRPLIDRSLQVCRRLLARHGLPAGDIETVVLVGGPTMIPLLRQRIAGELAPLAEGHDPMALVARGAALFAASAGLEARGASSAAVAAAKSPEAPATPGPAPAKLWLQHPAMAAGAYSHVIGKLVEAGAVRPVAIEIAAEGGAPQLYPLDADGAFVAEVALKPQQINHFRLSGRTAEGGPLEVAPPSMQIIHGVTLGDPPLSRSIGVALASDDVQVYFERGAPLPARRMFVHRNVEKLGGGHRLKIPIVQGEFAEASLCRLIGTLELGDGVGELPVGSDIEVTLELGRGGELQARAFVPRLDRVFEDVVHLRMPDASPATLEREAAALLERLGRLLPGGGDLARLGALDARLLEAQRAIESARGGDADAGQRAHRLLLDLGAELASLEDEAQWPALEADARDEALSTADWVGHYGQDAEKRRMVAVQEGLERAIETRSVALLRQHRSTLRQLRHACLPRHPRFWEMEFDAMAEHIDQATDPQEAARLVARGRAARQPEELREVVRALWPFFPSSRAQRERSFGSGIR